jgi:hypothetical protein
MGLGPYPTVGLAEAREMARKKLLDCREGVNPIQKRKAERSARLATQARAKIFKECAEAYMAAHLKVFLNLKHRKQWESTLETYVYPILGSRLVSSINMTDVLSVLEQQVIHPKTKKPIGKFWETKTETDILIALSSYSTARTVRVMFTSQHQMLTRVFVINLGKPFLKLARWS